jgi:hypothetical protein
LTRAIAFVAAFRRRYLVARLGQQLGQDVALGGRIVDDQDVLDGHGGYLTNGRITR